MVPQQADSTDQDQKWCRYCNRLRPITDFRFQNKATGQRHPDCRTCRREGERARQQRAERTTVRKGIQKIRRVETLEAMQHWLDLLVYKVGGRERLAEIWRDMLTAKDIPISYRLTFLRTIMHMLASIDNTRAAESVVKSSNDLKKLNKPQLVEWIRVLLYEGYLSWEDVNPAGDWHGFDPW